MFATRILHVIDLRDRDLLHRWSLRQEAKTFTRWSWIVVTHAGGAVVTIASVVIPLATAPWPREITARVAAALTISHLLVQAIKRICNRERPALRPVIRCPDRFSFPSGHAAAALSVAMSYAIAFPAVAGLLIGLALVVGWSRVVLGVHYPGDVMAGQLIATATVGSLSLVLS